MTAPPGHDSPYPAAPPPDEQPRWFRIVWWAVSRVALFTVGAVIALQDDASDAQLTLGGGLMLSAVGIALIQGRK